MDGTGGAFGLRPSSIWCHTAHLGGLPARDIALGTVCLMSEETQIPAGWYEDPLHPEMTRWWDGTQWTEKVQIHQPGVAVSGRGKRVDIDVDGTVHKGRRTFAKMSGKTKFMLLILVAAVAYIVWKFMLGG